MTRARRWLTAATTDRRLRRAASLVGFAAVWWLLTQGPMDAFVGPIGTAETLVALLGGKKVGPIGSQSTLYVHAAYTAVRVVLGVAAAVAVAVPVGVAIGTDDRWRDWLFPALETLRPVPPIAWMPLAFVAFFAVELGAGPFVLETHLGVLFVIFVGAFFPVLVNTVEGVGDVEDEYLWAAESLGADRRQVFRHVVLPAALPSIVTGVALGVGLGWMTVVAAEMISSSSTGLGYLLMLVNRLINVAPIAVAMLTIGALGYASSAAVRAIGRRLAPWMEQEDGGTPR